MLEISDKIEPIHPAATIVLIRDGDQGLEALLVQRSKAVKHMGGMWVFPGGRVDDADHEDAANEYEAAVNAAVRETHEEAGLRIRRDQLVYQSHWTTPEGARKRFSTWFFLAILDDDQEVVVDGGEIAHHRWFRPQQAFEEIEDDGNPFRLMPPTFVSLVDIADYYDSDAAAAALGQRDAIIYRPRMIFVEDGICFLYEGDAGYETEDQEVPGPRHRTYMINEKLEYIREI
jgi:8-oxo-dGTP pyrophosphatase MutT (NUDIX family)